MNLDELQSAVRHAAQLRRPNVSVKTGSIENFVKAVGRRVELVQDETARGLIFCGVPVKENAVLPQNRAVLMSDNEILAIIDLDK